MVSQWLIRSIAPTKRRITIDCCGKLTRSQALQLARTCNGDILKPCRSKNPPASEADNTLLAPVAASLLRTIGQQFIERRHNRLGAFLQILHEASLVVVNDAISEKNLA